MILHSLHAENLGGHLGIDAVFNKIKERYYWPKMYQSVKFYVETCDKCQKRGNRSHQEELNPIMSYKSCVQWGIDVKGKLPETERGNKYIIVAMDYFTKWPEARAISDCKAKTIADFLFEEVICRHGVPKILISDRGTSFVNELIREVNQRLYIDHWLITPYHPQTNGQVEWFNRTLGETLVKLSTTHNN